ncbi:MAG: monovalent cation/hydrogen antiporter [Acidobacteriota bacterium]|jgi:CPA1 family monovalent cation:H+ antiporter|nr:monovalent cation/hydrogen antiporter [Acidobacteriota bacterium]
MASMPREQCPHQAAMSQNPAVETTTCAECGLANPTRVCLTCGHVGCCDSTNGHATAHAKASEHPIIRSLPLSPSSFTWCYQCNAYLN